MNSVGAARTIQLAIAAPITHDRPLPPLAVAGTRVVGAPGATLAFPGVTQRCVTLDAPRQLLLGVAITGCGTTALTLRSTETQVAESSIGPSPADAAVGITGEGTGVIGPRNDITGFGTAVRLTNDGYVVEGNRIHGNGAGVSLAGATATIRGNLVYRNELDGVQASPGPCTVVHNVFDANGRDGLSAANAAPGLTARNNLFTRNGGFGIRHGSAGSHGRPQRLLLERVGTAVSGEPGNHRRHVGPSLHSWSQPRADEPRNRPGSRHGSRRERACGGTMGRRGARSRRRRGAVPRTLIMSIRYQILALMSVVLLGAIALYLVLATQLLTRDKLAYIYDLESSLGATISEEVRASVGTLVDKLSYFAADRASGGDAAAQALLSSDEDLLSVEVWERGRTGRFERVLRHVARARLDAANLSEQDLAASARDAPIPFEAVAAGEVVLQNASLPPDMAILSIAAAARGSDRVVVAALEPDRLLRIFARSTAYRAYLVDGLGRLVVHPDAQSVVARASFAAKPIVAEAIRGTTARGAREVEDPGGALIAAYSRVGIGRLSVIVEVPRSEALRASRQLLREVRALRVRRPAARPAREHLSREPPHGAR